METVVAWPDSELNEVAEDIAYYAQVATPKGGGQLHVEVGVTKFAVPLGASPKQVKTAQFMSLRKKIEERRNGSPDRRGWIRDDNSGRRAHDARV